MENPFKEKANRFLKNAKLAGLGLAIGASSLNEAEAQNVHGTFVDNSKRIEIIFEHIKNKLT